jgi:hypothetical protein
MACRQGREMETPTISINTPLEEVVMLARRFDQIAVEGDDTFEKAILETINAASLDGAARRRRARARTRKFGLLLLVAVLLGLIAVGVWIWPEFQSGGILFDTHGNIVIQDGGSVTNDGSGHHLDARQDTFRIVQILSWPSVVIVVSFLTYLVIRQAIKSGNTVEMSWKITQRAQGRIVVRKVVERRRALI